MPTIPETWWERNFGPVPTVLQPTLGKYARVYPETQAEQMGVLPKGADPKDYRPDAIESWRETAAQRTAQQAAAERGRRAAEAEKVASARKATADARVQLRRALEAARAQRQSRWESTDWSALNQDPKAGMSRNVMITPDNVKSDLGRNLTDKDKFWTGQFDTQTTQVIGQARNRYEAMLDSRVVGTQVKNTPITVAPRYRDASGEALWYAQQQRLNQGQIQAWQAYFVARGMIQPGQFVYGAWDTATQKAMYATMGEANSMGQTVDGLRASYEAQWKSMNPNGYGPGSGGAGPARPTTTTQRIFSITSLAKGGQILKAYLQQELGRDPSKAEIAAYVRLLNGQERKNPTVVTTHYNADGSSSTQTTKEANVDPGDTADTFMGQQLKKEKGARDTMEYMSILAGM